MISEVFITCALTGGRGKPKYANVPVTPERIADSALEAARAGAAVVHIHVRHPETGQGSWDPALHRKVVQRIRRWNVDPVINLTTGTGWGLVLGGAEPPLTPAATTNMAGALERMVHIEELRPEICTLDCGTLNYGTRDELIVVNAPAMVRAVAARSQKHGVRPKLEVSDTGDLVLVNDLIKEGLIDDSPLIQLCMRSIPTALRAIRRAHGAGARAPAAGGLLDLLDSTDAFPQCGAGTGARRKRAGGIGGQPVPPAVGCRPELVYRAVEIPERVGVGVMTADEARQNLASKFMPEKSKFMFKRSKSSEDRPRADELNCSVVGAGWAARIALEGVDLRQYGSSPVGACRRC